jgi:hypothetical protein
VAALRSWAPTWVWARGPRDGEGEVVGGAVTGEVTWVEQDSGITHLYHVLHPGHPAVTDTAQGQLQCTKGEI